MPAVHAIVLASGVGSRLRDATPKQFLKVAGKSLVEHTVDVFESHPRIDHIHLVVAADYRHFMEEILLKNHYSKIGRLLNGGASRDESSRIGIGAIQDDEDLVLLHDAVRPFVTHRIIDDCLEALETHDAVDVAIPSPDTIIRIDDDDVIVEIPERRSLRLGQTPQAFRVGVIRRAHEMHQQELDFKVTDDCGLIVHYDLAPIKVVAGDSQNMKVTYREDLAYADRLFQLRSRELPADAPFEVLADKVMVVIGGHRGIGEEIVKQARGYGAHVYPFSRKDGVDVTDYDSIETTLADVAAKEHGRIDYVVNTAGVLGMGRLEDRPLEEVHEEIAINYMGTIHVAKAAMPHLRETHGGLLLFTSSSYSRGRALYSTYTSSKAAIVNLTQALSEEVSHLGVRINVINPERTATPMRFEAFGKEEPGSLLSPEKAADASLRTLLADFTGQLIDVRR